MIEEIQQAFFVYVIFGMFINYSCHIKGQQLQCVEIPSASRITSCCFGGKNLDELYVTSSAYEVSSEEFEKYPLSGSVFRVTGLGVRGRKAHIYEG